MRADSLDSLWLKRTKSVVYADCKILWVEESRQPLLALSLVASRLVRVLGRATDMIGSSGFDANSARTK